MDPSERMDKAIRDLIKNWKKQNFKAEENTADASAKPNEKKFTVEITETERHYVLDAIHQFKFYLRTDFLNPSEEHFEILDSLYKRIEGLKPLKAKKEESS